MIAILRFLSRTEVTLYQAKVEAIKASNKNPVTAAQKIAKINQETIWREAWQTNVPKKKSLRKERLPVNVFKDLPMNAYVMETTFADGTKTTQTLQGTKK